MYRPLTRKNECILPGAIDHLLTGPMSLSLYLYKANVFIEIRNENERHFLLCASMPSSSSFYETGVERDNRYHATAADLLLYEIYVRIDG